MPVDVSRSAHAVFILPEPSISIWAAQTTVTEAGPSAGQPTPTASTQMALTATGDQSEDIRVRVQQPGLPRRGSGGARAIWRGETDADTGWRGWDPPRGPSSWEGLLWDDSDISAVDHLDAITTESETVICVAQIQDTGEANEYRLEALVRDASAGTWSRVLIEDSATAPSPSWRPCIMVLPSGRVQVYRVLAAVTGSQLRMWYSDDEGATWTHGGDGLRAVAVGAPTMQRVAYSDGQVLMVGRTSSQVEQYASSDNGHSFESVGPYAGAAPANFDLVGLPSGGFVALIIGEDAAAGVDAVVLADAYEGPNVAEINSLPTEFAAVGVDEDVAIAIDGAGILHCIARDGALTIAGISYDGGSTWRTYESATSTSIEDVLDYGSTGSSYPQLFALTPHAGRMCLVHQWSAGGTAPSGTGVGCYYLGGWTTQTTPSREVAVTDEQAAGWTKVWYPTEIPAAATNWTPTSSGSPTAAFDASALKITAPAAAQLYYTSPVLTTGNCGFRVSLRTSGGALGFAYVAARLHCSNCTVVVRFSPAGFRVVDGAGTAIGADVAVNLGTTVYQVWVEVDTSTRLVRSWYRPYGHGPDREWTVGPTDTLASATPTRGFEFGEMVGSPVTINSWWHEVVVADGDARPRAGTEGTVNPTDLRGRLICGSPYYGADVRLTARHGPAYRGEEWTIPTWPDFRLEHAVSTPTPRISWRSTSTAAQTIALQWDEAATPGQRAVLAIVLRGSNIPKMTINGLNAAGSPTALASSLDLTIGTLSYARTGSAVKPGSTQDHPYLRHGDYQGATFCLGTGVGRRIARQAEGKWDSAANLQPVIRLEGVDDGADPASGSDGTIIPDQVVVLLELSTDYCGIRLDIPAASGTFAPAENYWEIGSIIVGWAYPVGYRSSWGRTLGTELPSESITTRDRQQRTVRTAPPVRTMSLAWSDGLDQTDVESDTADPDWVAIDTVAGASAAGTAYQLDGIMREVHGTLGELVYMPRVDVLTGVDVWTRRRDALHCRTTGEIIRETIQGEESVDEVVRIAEVTLTEVV